MISYEPLWKTLKEKNISTYTLINKYNISSEKIHRIKKNGAINTTTIDDLCKILECRVDEIILFTNENN